MRPILLPLLALVACLPFSVGCDVEKMLDAQIEKIDKQARQRMQASIKNATILVTSAYNYPAALPDHTLTANAKLIAVQVDVKGQTNEFFLEGLEIRDGSSDKKIDGSDEDFGGVLESWAIKPDGTISPSYDDLPYESTAPHKALLIFEVPAPTSSVKLAYGDLVLTQQAIPLAATGPLPPAHPAN